MLYDISRVSAKKTWDQRPRQDPASRTRNSGFQYSHVVDCRTLMQIYFLDRLYSILYYTILYYTILYYTILYYTILYYTILYYTIPYHTNAIRCEEPSSAASASTSPRFAEATRPGTSAPWFRVPGVRGPR